MPLLPVTNMISSLRLEGGTGGGGMERQGELVRPAPGAGHGSEVLEVSFKVPPGRKYMNETDREDRNEQSRTSESAGECHATGHCLQHIRSI